MPLTRVSTLTYLLQIFALQERVENPFGDLHPRPACLPGFCAAIYLRIAYHQAQTTTTSTGLSQTFARVHTRMNCKSPLNTPLETFALGQCVPSWTLRKSLRQRGIESNWLVKGTTLICSKEQEHETVSGIHCMWSKGERSAQTLGLLGVILGVTILMLGQSTTDERSDARVGTRTSAFKRVASRLNTSLEICAGLV